MIAIALPLLLVTASTDHLAIVDFKPDSDKLSLEIRAPLTGPSAPAGVVASDNKFFRADGKRPVRFVFGADIDGDGFDEIVTIRQRMKNNDRYELHVYSPPDAMGGNVGKPIASAKKLELGTPQLFGEIICAKAIDTDGDFVDELMLLRQSADGTQRLEIRGLPTGMKQELAPHIASYLDFGHDPFDRVIDVAAVDVNADFVQEIAVIRKSAMGQVQVQVVRAPLIDDDTKPFLQHLAIFGNSIDLTSVTGVDVNADGVDEIGLIRRISDAQYQWVLHPLDGPTVITSAGMIDGPMFHAFTLRGPSAGDGTPIGDGGNVFDPETLDGNYTVNLSHSTGSGYTGGESFNFNLGGWSVDASGGDVTVLTNDGQSTVGLLNAIKKSIQFGLSEIVVQQSGNVITLKMTAATVFTVGDSVKVLGAYFGTHKKPNGTVLNIGNGKFTLTQVSH